MENKKFNSYLGLAVRISMILSIFYIIYTNLPKDVSSYKVDSGYSYTGSMHKSKFDGKGSLVTPDGVYEGDFSNSRFSGPGVFTTDTYTYRANFDHEAVNTNITITLADGSVYRKLDGLWVEVGQDEN